MSDREVWCGDELIEVRRWMRPGEQIAAGALLPFMVSKAGAQFVRDHEGDPFVLRTPRDGWSLEIVSVESAGTDGVWVSAKAVSRISRRPTAPSPVRGLRATLVGIPVPKSDPQNE